MEKTLPIRARSSVAAPILVLLSVLAVFALSAQTVLAAPIVGLPDFTKLVNANRAAVVNIGTTGKRQVRRRGTPPGVPVPEGAPGDDSALQDFFRRFFGEEPPGGNGRSQPHSSLGSGFIISPDGYVISNYHVVREAEEIIVRLSDRREYVAKIIGTDPRSDIAVLKVEAEKPLPSLRLGKSQPQFLHVRVRTATRPSLAALTHSARCRIPHRPHDLGPLYDSHRGGLHFL